MRRGPGWRAIGLSALIHGVLVVPMLFARPTQPIEFETIRINLVSPPPADVVDPEPASPQLAPEPEPEPEQVAPTPEATVEETPPERPPEEDIERPETERPPETPPERTPPATTEPSDPADTAAAGGEGLNIQTEGREFPYPEYLSNVIIQVHRYFRWSGDDHPRGVIYFEILRDGSVRNIRMARSSGNIRFDFAVQGAVETAGNRGAFGPLPDGFAAPTLPVQLEVEPPR